MIPKTRMTIQDYFNRAGLGRVTRFNRLENSTLQGTGARKFLNHLNRLHNPEQTEGLNPSGGLHITDYLKNPIQAKVRRSNRTVNRPVYAGPATDSFKSAIPDLPMQTVKPKTADPVGRAVDHNADDAIENSVIKASAKYDLPARLIRSVIRAESNFKPNAVSPAGAQGLMQLMPATAEDLGVKDAFDVEQNIDGGARYLRQMLDMFDGNLKKALAAYNAGPGTVIKYNGNVPYRETRNYVRKVMAYANQSGEMKANT